MKIVLNISYLGTNYAGFQVQPNAITVQERLQDAVERLFGYRCPLTGCSRTDSGVHAGMFVCTIDTEGAVNSPPIEKVADALNHYLPDDISVNEAKVAPDDFHPRYDVKSKEYCYVIWNARPKNPFLSHRALHWPTPLDESLMNEAAEHFVGEHDFAAFCRGFSALRTASEKIGICVHMILGLPGEDDETMMQTVRDVAALHPNQVKIHLLHVLRGTKLAKLYERGDYQPLEREHYIRLVVDALELLPPDVVIGRLTGDGAADALLAPLWSRKKTTVINDIDKLLYARGSMQGRLNPLS
jgi:tRNA pseudouridine(38-40) synthase